MAHTTARSSTSVAKYRDSAAVTWRELHCKMRQSPDGCCCHRAIPRPFDCAASVFQAQGAAGHEVRQNARAGQFAGDLLERLLVRGLPGELGLW